MTMEALSRFCCFHKPPRFSLAFSRQFSFKSCSSVSIPSSSSSQSLRPLAFAASQSPPHLSAPSPPSLSQSPDAPPKHSLPKALSTACIALVASAAAAFAAMALTGFGRPAMAATSLTATRAEPVGEMERDNDECDKEREKELQRNVTVNPRDVEALRSLLEIRIKSQQLKEAIEIVDRLIDLEPVDDEWPLLKAQIQNFDGNHDKAKAEFEEILAKDPLRVEAYHGLVTAYHETGLELTDLENRINNAMGKCDREKRDKDFRDFKLLVAQLRVIQGDHSEALKLYEELVKEEPRDCRPYLCLGILYSLLKKEDEAEKYFEMFQKLVPEDHPYREYFGADSADKVE